MQTQRKILDIAIGLVICDEKLLITKRKPDAHLGSLWEFPGGKVGPQETPEAAVVRELREETGLEVNVEGLFHEEVAHYPERSVQLRFYKCWFDGNPAEAKALAATALTWVSVGELDQYDFPSGNDGVLKRIKALLEI